MSLLTPRKSSSSHSAFREHSSIGEHVVVYDSLNQKYWEDIASKYGERVFQTTRSQWP